MNIVKMSCYSAYYAERICVVLASLVIEVHFGEGINMCHNSRLIDKRAVSYM